MSTESIQQNEYVFSVADLVDRPGSSRRVDVALPVPDQLGTAVVSVSSPLRLHGVLESVVDGVLVRGALDATMHMLCARCLVGVTDSVRVDVVELFVDPARTTGEEDSEVEEGYEIVGSMDIDLDTLLRDALLSTAPYQPRCSDDCKGLCVSCGADLNEVECSCADEDFDPRWAPLAQLRLPDDDTSA